jgi:hypothetical protein
MRATAKPRAGIRPRHALAGLVLGALVLSRLDEVLGVLMRWGVLR